MLTDVRPEGDGLSLQRRASLGRETLRLIRSIADSLAQDAEQARLHCAFAGDPKLIAQELDTLVELAGGMRRQSDQLTRAFAVLDRLFPQTRGRGSATASPLSAAAGWPGRGSPSRSSPTRPSSPPTCPSRYRPRRRTVPRRPRSRWR
jgi:hypothetical protein